MLRFALTGLLLATTASTAAATQLVARAVLPAATFAPGPSSGQFITPANGVTPPFPDQSVQGFSGVVPGPVPGTFDFILDNGFGAKSNSADSLLRVFALRPNFNTGQVTPVDFNTGVPTSFSATNWYITVSDPNNLAGFTRVADMTNYPNGANNIPVDPSIRAGKLLTGSDFDNEGIARAKDGSYYFGEEFGPFLYHTDAAGRLLAAPVVAPNPLATAQNGRNPLIQGPDYPTPTGNSLPPKGPSNEQGSGGFEGFAMSPDKSRIYTMLEKSLLNGSNPAQSDPNQSRRIINVYDTATNTFLPAAYYYKVGDPNGNNNGIDPTNNSIGDMVMINDHQMLVLERDQNQGSASRFKRVYLIDLNDVDPDGFAHKTLVADLLNIADPGNRGGNGTVNGVFTMPFVTLEDIIPIDAQTILVGNDNNYPFSAGRTPGVPDDNELALIRLDAPLALDARLALSVDLPEPGSVAVLGLALAGLAAARRRTDRKDRGKC